MQKTTIRERDIEKKFNEEVKKIGGLSLKFVSPGNSGVPDRMVLLKNGYAVFAEIKRPGEQMRPLQVYRRKQFEAMGFSVWLVDSTETIHTFINEMKKRLNDFL